MYGLSRHCLLYTSYALYTRPQDDFINAGNGGGIGWALIDDITRAEVKDEMIITVVYYHTIKEVKNGEGPHPIRTSQGLSLIHIYRDAVIRTLPQDADPETHGLSSGDEVLEQAISDFMVGRFGQ